MHWSFKGNTLLAEYSFLGSERTVEMALNKENGIYTLTYNNAVYYKEKDVPDIEPQMIKATEITAEFKSNAVAAANKYLAGPYYYFYFTPTSINSDGECEGSLYDSYDNEWNVPCKVSSSWKVEMGENAAVMTKGVKYKIIGNIEGDWDSEMYNSKITNASIVE